MAFAIVMALLVGYGAGQYLPYGQVSQTLSELGPMIRGGSITSSQDITQTTRSQPSVVPFVTAQVLFNAYSNNAASANSMYQGKEYQIGGAVSEVDQDSNNNYLSCQLMLTNQPGISSNCDSMNSLGWYVLSWVVYHWQSPQQASLIDTGNPNLVVACQIAGVQNTIQLVLNNCQFVSG